MTLKVAFAYDFDGTLAPGNMQERHFIPKVSSSPSEFWSEAKDLAEDQRGDEILAYMRLMIDKATYHKIKIDRESFQGFGADLEFFPGVLDGDDTPGWFPRLNDYAEASGIELSHFIISSGIREMIEGTPIADYFSEIYASSYQYDVNGSAVWPALAVNYTTKTQFLFRINKGSLEPHDNSVINAYVPDGERPIPFSRIVFFGDGATDIPVFRLVKDLGGHSVAVFDPNKDGSERSAQNLRNEGRVHFFCEANFADGGPVDRIAKNILDKIQIDGKLAEFS